MIRILVVDEKYRKSKAAPRLRLLLCEQGDQIGRIFASWVMLTLDSILKNTEVHCKIFGQHFTLSYCFNFDKKKDYATFWAIFLQNHLVALSAKAVCPTSLNN
jgi:hypothetical protein